MKRLLFIIFLFASLVGSAQYQDTIWNDSVRLLREKFPKQMPEFKATSLSDPNLSAAYNMIPSANAVLTDISTNSNNGTISGAISNKDGLVFGGTNDYVDIGAIADVNGADQLTFATRFKRADASSSIEWGSLTLVADGIFLEWFSDDKVYFAARNGSTNNVNVSFPFVDEFINVVGVYDGTLAEADRAKIYINGVLQTVSASGTTPATLSATAGNTFYLGRISTVYSTGEIWDAQIYNYAFTSDQAIDYHNSFNKPVLIDNFRWDAVGDVPVEWIPGTGTYALAELTTQDAVLSHIDKGYKYLNCSSAGTIAIQSKTAYGTWEFDWYKSGSSPNIIFINNQKTFAAGEDGYNITLGAGENVTFVERNAGGGTVKFNTANSYISENTWYRYRITRTFDGEFYTYIKGGAFGNTYTLVDVTGGSGTNPFTDNTNTTSEYFVLDFDQNDRIGNIVITNSVEQ